MLSPLLTPGHHLTQNVQNQYLSALYPRIHILGYLSHHSGGIKYRVGRCTSECTEGAVEFRRGDDGGINELKMPTLDGNRGECV